MTFSNLATHMLLITLAGLAVGMPSNPLSKRVGRDCGAWTIYCGGIPQEDGSFGYSAVGACNNACHFINIYKNGEYTAVYRTDTDIKRNGFHSGCRAANSERRKYAWDVCTTMPFSQQYVHQDHSTGRAKHELTGYRFVEDINPGDSDVPHPICNEFPMAEMRQDDFTGGATPRNTLRCIPGGENVIFQHQYEQFIKGQGKHLKGRTCEGPLGDDDYFRVEFNYDNVDAEDVPFCRMGDNDPHNVTLDKYEFYMTTMRGRNTFPYQPASNNLYVGSTTKVEISQCRTDVDREETDDGDKYQIRLFDVGGNQIAENSKVLRKYDESVEARTQDGKHMTSVTRKGAIRDGTEKGGDMWFQYFGDRTNTMWVRDGIGADMRYSKTEGFTGNEGGFCSVPVLEGEKKRQRVSCYHSCEK